MSIKQQVKRFWKVFLEEKKNLEVALHHGQDAEVKEIVSILNTYFEEMSNASLEVGMDDDFYELTFLSGQDKNVQLVSALLKEMTPAVVKENWIINAYLPALSEKALHTVLKIQDKEYHPEDFIVYYTINEASKTFNIELYCDAFTVLDANKASEIAIYMMQLFVGECDLEAYIGDIQPCDVRKSGNAATLSDFYEVMNDIISEKDWPEYHDPTSIYRVYKLQESKAVSEVRKDMKMIFTVHPILISEVLNEEYVTYHQFYDIEGEFGYLYYKNSHGDQHDALYRQKLEKKLNELLFPHGIAKSIGGAIGSMYSYIDVAIYDKDEFLKALDKINDKLSIKLSYQSFEEDHK